MLAEYFESIQFVGDLICSDFLTTRLPKQYDLVISQAVLRHVGDAKRFLDKMVQATKREGEVHKCSIEVKVTYLEE